MEARRRALGRGLGALIPGAGGGEDGEQRQEVRFVPIESIKPNPYQPRQRWDEQSLAELAASISEKGLLQPLLVRRAPADPEGYQLIAGERRFRASKKAGLATVPVVVRHADEGESLELALIENLQREDLNPIEEALAYDRLAREFGLTQEEIARRVGKTRSTIANSVRLLNLPPSVQQQLQSGELSAGHARSLLSVSSIAQQVHMANAIVARKLNVRDSEHLARGASGAPRADGNVTQAEAELARALGTKVRIHHKKDGAGRIEIDYYSLAGLNGLIARITGLDDATAAF